MRMVVLLPEPLAPRKAKMEPGRTSMLRSSTAVKSPKRLVRPRTRMIGAVIAAHACSAAPATPWDRASRVDSMSTGAARRSARRRRAARAGRPRTRTPPGCPRCCAPRRARSVRWRARPRRRAARAPRGRWRARRRPRRGRARAGTLARSSAGVPLATTRPPSRYTSRSQACRLVEVAGADQHQRARCARCSSIVQISARAMTSTPGRRLVEQQQRRAEQQGVGHRELLLHPAGERAGGALGERGQPGALQQLAGCARRTAAAGRRCRRAVKRRFSITDSSRCRLNALRHVANAAPSAR